MQNWQNMEVLWSFVGVQYTLNAAWWVTTIHNILKINLYAQAFFFIFKLILSLYDCCFDFEDFFFLLLNNILFSTCNAELEPEVGLYRRNKVDADSFQKRLEIWLAG